MTTKKDLDFVIYNDHDKGLLRILEQAWNNDYTFIKAFFVAFNKEHYSGPDKFSYAVERAEAATGRKAPYSTKEVVNELTKEQADSIARAITSVMIDSVLMYTEK